MGSQTPIFAIPYPVGTDRVMDGDDAMAAIATSVENLIKLPDRVTAYSAATPNTVTSTTWANLPTRISCSLTLARPALVLCTFGAWISLQAASTAGDLRLGINITGATTDPPPGLGWGETGYININASQSPNQIACSVGKHVLCAAGTTTFELQAMKSGTNTAAANYGTISVTPLRYTG